MIPERLLDLMADDVANICMLGVTLADGSPHVTPVWFRWDGEFLIVNSARGRVKDRAMRARPYVAATVIARDDLYHWVQVRGPVVEITEAGAHDEIIRLSVKYRGRAEYPLQPGEVRVTYKIRPQQVTPQR